MLRAPDQTKILGMNISWSHCVLKVNDLDVMISFYCDTLGFRLADRGALGPKGEIAFLSGSSSDHHQLALMTGRRSEEKGALDHNAFRTGSIQDVLDIVDKIEADERTQSGVPVSHGNAVSVYFSDPEGNGIEVFCDTPWHVKQPQAKTWDPTLSADEVLAWVESSFKDSEEFMPMEEYRQKQAVIFGE